MLITKFIYRGPAVLGQWSTGIAYFASGFVVDSSGVVNALIAGDSNSFALSGNILDTALWQFAGQSVIKDSLTVFPSS